MRTASDYLHNTSRKPQLLYYQPRFDVINARASLNSWLRNASSGQFKTFKTIASNPVRTPTVQQLSRQLAA